MELTRRHALQLIGGTSLTGIAGCLDSGSSCDPACFESDYLGYDDALAVMTITHVGGKGILAQELFVSGVADEYPTAPGEGCTRPWHKWINLKNSRLLNLKHQWASKRESRF